MKTSFGSDNHSGVHPKVLQALTDANRDYCLSYEEDTYTARAVEVFRTLFGEDTHVYFAFNGTAANVLCLQALTRPHHAVVCAHTAHLNRDECGAPNGLRVVNCLLPRYRTGNCGLLTYCLCLPALAFSTTCSLGSYPFHK